MRHDCCCLNNGSCNNDVALSTARPVGTRWTIFDIALQLNEACDSAFDHRHKISTSWRMICAVSNACRCLESMSTTSLLFLQFHSRISPYFSSKARNKCRNVICQQCCVLRYVSGVHSTRNMNLLLAVTDTLVRVTHHWIVIRPIQT